MEENLSSIRLKENGIFIWIQFKEKNKTIYIIERRSDFEKSIRIDEDENGNSTISTILIEKDQITSTGPVPLYN